MPTRIKAGKTEIEEQSAVKVTVPISMYFFSRDMALSAMSAVRPRVKKYFSLISQKPLRRSQAVLKQITLWTLHSPSQSDVYVLIRMTLD